MTVAGFPQFKWFNGKKYTLASHSSAKYSKKSLTTLKSAHNLKGIRQVKIGSSWVLYAR